MYGTGHEQGNSRTLKNDVRPVNTVIKSVVLN